MNIITVINKKLIIFCFGVISCSQIAAFDAIQGVAITSGIALLCADFGIEYVACKDKERTSDKVESDEALSSSWLSKRKLFLRSLGVACIAGGFFKNFISGHSAVHTRVDLNGNKKIGDQDPSFREQGQEVSQVGKEPLRGNMSAKESYDQRVREFEAQGEVLGERRDITCLNAFEGEALIDRMINVLEDVSPRPNESKIIIFLPEDIERAAKVMDLPTLYEKIKTKLDSELWTTQSVAGSFFSKDLRKFFAEGDEMSTRAIEVLSQISLYHKTQKGAELRSKGISAGQCDDF